MEKSTGTKEVWSSTSASVPTLPMNSTVDTSPNQSSLQSPSLQQSRKSNTEVLSVSLSLVLGVLAAVGVVIAVLFVRWKR